MFEAEFDMNHSRPIVAMPATGSSRDHSLCRGLLGAVFGTNRFVLGIALFCAVIVPEYFHRDVAALGYWFAPVRSGLEPTLIAAALAIVVAHISMQKVGMLPLIESKRVILPTFMLSYAAVIAILYLSLGSFGRYHIWSSFLIAVPWYFCVALVRGRLLRPVLAMIGSYDVNGDRPLPHVDWIVLDQPVLCRPVSAVVVDPHACLDVVWSNFITQLVLEGVPVYHRSHIEEGMLGRVKFQSHAEINFGALLPSLSYLRLKRLFDLGGALLLAPFAGLVIGIAAIAIRLESPGPAIFRQIRMGFRGRPFTCYKLRSMYVGGDGPSFTLESDSRITRVGRVIRKWRIDELPQIWNVFKGDMSWIGPRPEALGLACEYQAHVPFYAYRHAVRPGISGWAAVHQGNVAMVEAAKVKLEYDFYYIKYFSFWLDFIISLKTIGTIFSGFGSR